MEVLHWNRKGEVLTSSEEDTRERARQYAIMLRVGDVVVLSGDLGAGKTAFTKGIADVFACASAVSSPTFGIVNCYEGNANGQKINLYHFDFYRIENDKEFEAIGFEEYTNDTSGICVIEWGEKFPNVLPSRHKQVDFYHVGETQRRIVATK